MTFLKIKFQSLLTLFFILVGTAISCQTIYIQATKIKISVFGTPVSFDTNAVINQTVKKSQKVEIILLKNDSLLITKKFKIHSNKRGCGIKDLGFKTYYRDKEIKVPRKKITYKQYDGGFFSFLVGKIIYGLGIHPGYEQWSAKGTGWFGSHWDNYYGMPSEDSKKIIHCQFYAKYGWSKTFHDQ